MNAECPEPLQDLMATVSSTSYNHVALVGASKHTQDVVRSCITNFFYVFDPNPFVAPSAVGQVFYNTVWRHLAAYTRPGNWLARSSYKMAC